MAKQFSIYKGLQKPLIYKGFQGKFIGWGIASLDVGLVQGGVMGRLSAVLRSLLLGGSGFVGS